MPDDRPPRLSEDAKKGIRRLAAYLRQARIDVDTVTMQYSAVEELAGKELEPKMLYGLLLLKARKRDEAVGIFEEIKIEDPELLLPLQGLVWVQFEKRYYRSGMNALVDLLDGIAKPKKADAPYPAEAQGALRWAGLLREYAAVAAEQRLRPPQQSLDAVDAAAAAHGRQATQFYQQGRDLVKKTAGEFDAKIAAAAGEAATAKLKIERRLLNSYTNFPFNELAKQVVAGLDE